MSKLTTTSCGIIMPCASQITGTFLPLFSYKLYRNEADEAVLLIVYSPHNGLLVATTAFMCLSQG
ncbi:hypothetical protein BGX38DRAFT_1194369 [Terfezia claveryi]|nr:hypothetical protein BGX38DRAFT_1194369 [Terfezia claveryi]